jgi:alanyl-tRNA synthetase
MLRRAVAHARRLGTKDPVLPRVIGAVIEGFGEAYPELRENEAFVLQVAEAEEERFSATLRHGMTLFDEAKSHAREGRIAGADAFRLSDQEGFPLELIQELADEADLTVDVEGFRALLQEQRDRARASAKKVAIGLDTGATPPSEFVGYEHADAEAPIALLLDDALGTVEVAEEGHEVRVFLERTPFYAEGGGQIGDRGTIRTPTGVVRVTDTQRVGDHAIMHVGVVESGEISPGQEAHAEIDREARASTARAHTSTHIVHWTLKHLLGEHAKQAGSLVAPGRLRFDFPHPSAVAGDVLEEAEREANRRLARDDAVRIFETTMEEAQSLGAIALFEEKYGDMVRVVEIGDYSRELCGGTHVPRTGNVAVIRIMHEGSIGAGMRRVEALVGPDALREINAERDLLRGLVAALDAKDPHAALERARRVMEENKRLRTELGALRAGDRGSLIASLAEGAQDVDGVDLVVAEVPGEDPGGLRELAQKIRDRLQGRAAAVVLGNGEGGKAMLVAACTPAAVERGVSAPALLGPAAAVVDGGAGGRDLLANAGGKDPAKVPEALGQIPATLRALLA